MPAVLYGCDKMSISLMEEHGLRAFENRILIKIRGPEKDEVTGDCRGLHNGELYDLYSSPNIIRETKCETGGEDRCIQVFGGET